MNRTFPISCAPAILLASLAIGCSKDQRIESGVDTTESNDVLGTLEKIHAMNNKSAVSGEQRYVTVQKLGGRPSEIEIVFQPGDNSKYTFFDVIGVASDGLDEAVKCLSVGGAKGLNSEEELCNDALVELVRENLVDVWKESRHGGKKMRFLVNIDTIVLKNSDDPGGR